MKYLEGVEVHGCDIDREAVEWCSQHLPRGRFTAIPPYPPTAYAESLFDVVHAYFEIADDVRRAGEAADPAHPQPERHVCAALEQLRDPADALGGTGDGFEVIHTLTWQQPADWKGYARRIDEQMLAEVLEPLGAETRAFACGPTALVEVAANALVRLGLPPDRIRTERFGPTGT